MKAVSSFKFLKFETYKIELLKTLLKTFFVSEIYFLSLLLFRNEY